jgi:hypothetical protein
MMRRVARMAACGLVAIGVAACDPDTGFAEIKVQPGYTLPALAIDKEPLALKTGTVILRRKVGAAKLHADRGGNLVAFCDFAVRKNRITTVSVYSTGRELHCNVQG